MKIFKLIYLLIWIPILPFVVIEGLKYGKGGVKKNITETITDIKDIIS